MFDILNAMQLHKDFEYAKTNSIENKQRPKNPFVKHIDDEPIDITAEKQGIALKKAFYPHTMDFGKRIIKRKGQSHRGWHGVSAGKKIGV